MDGGVSLIVGRFDGDRDIVALFLPEAITTSEYPIAILLYPMEAQVIPEPHCLSNAIDDTFAGNFAKNMEYLPPKAMFSLLK